jgi:hypothetical protein
MYGNWTDARLAGLGMVGIGLYPYFSYPLPGGLNKFGTAFIEKLINLDEKRKYCIITCGEEVHFAYNRVGWVHF